MNANPSHLEEMIQTLSAISEPCEAGVQRQAYSPEYRLGVNYIKEKMQEIGLKVYEDAVGNVFGYLPGSSGTTDNIFGYLPENGHQNITSNESLETASCDHDTHGEFSVHSQTNSSELPMIYSGSHLDTVRCAGSYDGIAGVVCAMEAARMIIESGQPLRHPYTVFGTVGEEGTRFGQVLMGSQFMAGVFGREQLENLRGIEDGKTLSQTLKEYGLAGDESVEESSLLGRPILGFVELHGEQGPVLEQSHKDIGIVNAIAGIAWLEVTVTGQANHSGTVPMNLRKDAGIAAYRMILDINDYITEKYCNKATMTAGQLKLDPGSSNCIPGKCIFTLDIRSGHKDILDEILNYVYSYSESHSDRIKIRSSSTDSEKNNIQSSSTNSEENMIESTSSPAQQTGISEGISIETKTFSRRDPVPMNPSIRSMIEKSAGKRSYSYQYLDSGAGHDSMIFAREWPTAMIFLPNKDGISHNPAEYIYPEDLKKGAEVLYETIRQMDEADIIEK